MPGSTIRVSKPAQGTGPLVSTDVVITVLGTVVVAEVLGERGGPMSGLLSSSLHDVSSPIPTNEAVAIAADR